MSFCVHFWMLLLLTLKSITQSVTDAKDLQILYHDCSIILFLETAIINIGLFNWGFKKSGEISVMYCRIWLKASEITH